MSTKIYYAQRFKVGNLNNFLALIREPVLIGVASHTIELIDAVTEEKANELYKKKFKDGHNPTVSKNDVLRRLKWEFVRDCYIKASKIEVRDLLFCIDFGFNLWMFEDYFYAIPVGEYWIKDLITQYPDFCEDYSYWNNTDRPDNITDMEWEYRSTTWDTVCLNNHNEKRLYYAIIDFSDGVDFDFFWNYIRPQIGSGVP